MVLNIYLEETPSFSGVTKSCISIRLPLEVEALKSKLNSIKNAYIYMKIMNCVCTKNEKKY